MTKYTQQKPETIQEMFSVIAPNYDKTNMVISLKLYQRWNRQLIEAVTLPEQPQSLLDMCAGTGEVSFAWLQQQKAPRQAILLDFCQAMLDIARIKADALNLDRHQIRYLQADAQYIPLENESIDAATIAYGIRNVKEPRLCVHEVFRVLKPGGKFGILELTEPQNPFLRFAHTLYMRRIMPMIGSMLTSDADAYRYLTNSIELFIRPQELEHMLRTAGFQKTTRTPLLGGIAHIILASK